MAEALRALLTRIGFSQEAAATITSNDGQGMDSLDEFSFLDNKAVETLCQVVRKPGGTIANPRARVNGQPARIPNPGTNVPLKAQDNLKLLCYWLRFKQNTSRKPTAAEITLATVREIRDHRDWQDEHSDPDDMPTIGKDWNKNIDLMEEYFRACLGPTGIPLAYIIREDESVLPSDNDPATNYPTKQDELIARAPFRGEAPAGGGAAPYLTTFLSDRDKVWEKLSMLSRNKDGWPYVRPFQ